MYNTNNSLMVNGVEGMGPTPRTPEILNSLMTMTNPFEISRNPRLASSPLSDSTSISNSPPSIQHTCSQLIKEGLKLTIQTKRRNNSETLLQDISTRSTQRPEEVSPDSLLGDVSCDGLTPEDEERRRRRRERNKIAATKCRLKKRERTTNLVQESEILETQNHDLKSQIQELENQRRRLVDMLSRHGATCTKPPYPSSNSTFATEYSRCSTTSSLDVNNSSYNYNEPYKQLGCDTAIYQRSSTVSDYRMTTTSTSYQSYEEGLMLPYRTEDTPDNYRSDPVYTNLNVNSAHTYIPPQGSPNSLFRPSSLSLNTSSSDYESNNEIIDSPSIPPVNYNQFDDDPVRYATGFSASSCIS